MLTKADLVAMLVLSTMLLPPSKATTWLKSVPLQLQVRRPCSPVSTSSCCDREEISCGGGEVGWGGVGGITLFYIYIQYIGFGLAGREAFGNKWQTVGRMTS